MTDISIGPDHHVEAATHMTNNWTLAFLYVIPFIELSHVKSWIVNVYLFGSDDAYKLVMKRGMDFLE